MAATQSPALFRGEPDGQLRERGSWLRPWFFAEQYNQANRYAGHGTVPVTCVISAARVLDITEPDPMNMEHRRLVKLMEKRHPQWVCRYSGEDRDLWSYLEGADLYNYDDDRGGRWNDLFQVAIEEMGYDAVRVMDCTDGTEHQPSPIWVTFNRENIRMATFGEKLAQMFKQLPWLTVRDAIERENPGLLERIGRLRRADESCRLDNQAEALGIRLGSEHLQVYRGLPNGADIRPGDWVALDRNYAQLHVRDEDTQHVRSLELVSPSDIAWAGTDENEFFYLPAAWRIAADSDADYLRRLSDEQIRMLCDGEESRITQRGQELCAISDRVLTEFDEDACGVYHGPDHWRRVSAHGKAVARSLGMDPLVPHIFGMVHDSQREDEGMDPEHGPRAALFIERNRSTLFSFLQDDEVRQLQRACELHSNGVTEGSALEMACWDADRLDLWRIGVKPDPRLLCTDYAKRSTTINAAQTFLYADRGLSESDEFLSHETSDETPWFSER